MGCSKSGRLLKEMLQNWLLPGMTHKPSGNLKKHQNNLRPLNRSKKLWVVKSENRFTEFRRNLLGGCSFSAQNILSFYNKFYREIFYNDNKFILYLFSIYKNVEDASENIYKTWAIKILSSVSNISGKYPKR